MPAFIPPALVAGAKAVAGAVATQAGRQAAVQGAKQAAKKVGKVAVQAGNTKAGQALTAGQIASNVGEQQANRQQMQQQNMMNQNQQMAQAAKAGSEIRTGEPMDILWSLMKAWKWDARWNDSQIDNIKAQMKRGKKHTVGLADRNHYSKNADKRIEPNQEMPKGLEGYSHEDVALAVADILLEKNPELKEHLNTKIETRLGNETYNDYPVLKVPGLSTDEPKEGIDRPHYVIGHKTSRAEDGGSGIGLITVGAEHHTGHRQTKEWHPIRDSEYEFVSAPKFMESKGPSAQEINQRAVERVAEGGRISRDDVSSSANLTNIFNPRNIYRQGAERMMQNFAGRIFIDPDTGAPRSTYLQAQHPLQQNLLNIRAKNDTVNPLNVGAEPTKVDRNDPTVQMMLSMGYVIETDEYGNEKLVLKSEPMDLAWRMLKGELQLSNEISEDMRRDLAVLDRNHTFEETSDGTMVGNIHPDMEHVVKLLTGMQEDVDDIAKPTYTPPQFYY